MFIFDAYNSGWNMMSSLQVCLLVLGCTGIITVSSQPIVTVEQGDIVGETVTFKEDQFIDVEKQINIFKGIPFAEPPLNELRFKPPVAKSPWEGVWNATYDRPVCHQAENPSNIMFEQNEDCLFLTVYAPNPTPLNAPVMFFIHGGGFSSGSGSQYEWIGTPMVATSDVILVNINYRLGVFGFLTTGDEASPGSYGMLDQVEALRWVQKNIHAFGGDPTKVTIFGNSAGGVSVDLHLYSKLSETLFERAIIQSAAGWTLFTTDLDAARDAAFQFGATLGCSAPADDADQLIDCLQTVPAADLLQASNWNMLLTNPVVDGLFLENDPLSLLNKQQFKRTNLLLGNNADEYAFFWWTFNPSPVRPPPMAKEQYDALVQNALAGDGYTSALMLDAVNQVYVDWTIADDPDVDYLYTYIGVNSDRSFICNMDLVARAHALAGDEVYYYHYTHYSSVKNLPQWTKAAHTDELQYVFGLAFNSVLTEFSEATDDEKRLAVNVMKYWTNFAKTGNPNKESMDTSPYTDDELAWPLYTVPGLKYKELQINLSTPGIGVRAQECQLWNSHLPQLGTFVGNLEEVEKEWREEFYTWKYDDMENWRDEFDKYKQATQL